jgi:CPA2 family monovalent cation:H+ antiporter-2
MDGFLLLAFLFLIAGVVAVPIASRLGLGSVLGYLLAGIVISPILGWLHVDVVSIQHFAEFGVVMMLFLVGLELEPRMLWEMRNKLLGLGGLQVALTALIVTGVAVGFGQTWSVALAIGMVFSLSSTAIVLQTLNEKGLMRSGGGQSSFSVLLFQDIAVIPMLAFIPFLALPELQELAASAHGTADDGHASLSLVDRVSGWKRALFTAGAIAFVVIVGSYLTRPIFRFIAMARLRVPARTREQYRSLQGTVARPVLYHGGRRHPVRPASFEPARHRRHDTWPDRAQGDRAVPAGAAVRCNRRRSLAIHARSCSSR